MTVAIFLILTFVCLFAAAVTAWGWMPALMLTGVIVFVYAAGQDIQKERDGK